MKFPPYSSPATSTTTTTTTTTNSKSNSYIQKSISYRGVIGILGRLLCFNTLPMHPLDQSREISKEAKECGVLDYGKQVNFEAMGNPGIVGRLMGLDSMPEVGLGGTQTRPNAIIRSHSTNYADTWRKELEQGKQRRINSTLSFRDAQPYVKLETEEFFILSFEAEGKDNELVLKTRKADKDSGELKQKMRDKCRSKNRRRENRYESIKENLAPNIVPDDVRSSKVQDTSKILQPTTKLNQNSDVAGEEQPKSIGQRQSGERRRSRRKKKENCSPVKKFEMQSDSENSSPGYVLDISDSPPEPEVQSSEDERLSGELESYKHSSPIIISNSINNDDKADKSDARHLYSWTNDSEFQNYAEMREEICKLTKTEMMESNRMYSEPRKLEDFKGIGAAISLEILDQLISEFLELYTSKQDKFEL